MNWTTFKTYEIGYTKAFESLCNQIFEKWVKATYQEQVVYFTTVRGDGGDGGVESYAQLRDGSYIGLQAKWFIDGLEASQISQIEKSIRSALFVRPQMKTYVVCIPQDLTSKKKVKGDKVTENTEENRWNELKAKIAKDFPGLELVLWDDYTLTTHLQRSDLEGARRFWFDSEAITFDSLIHQFEKAKASWLKERYVPDLHASGHIFKSSAFLLRTTKARLKSLGRMDGVRDIAVRLKNELETFQKVLGRDLEPPSKDLLQFVTTVAEFVDRNLDGVRNSSDIEEFQNEDKTNYGILDDQLRSLDTSSQFRILSEDIKKLVEEWYALNPKGYLAELSQLWNGRFRIFSGGPGTGKTHALANIVDVSLSQRRPAILIQAKSVIDPSSWHSILQRSLGLGADWSEIQILNALESRANVVEIENRHLEQPISAFSSVLICVDGLDEASDWTAWKNRIQEINVLVRSHPRLRFIVSSRDYMLEDTNLEKDLQSFVVQLPSEGDVPIYKIFDRYMERFKIDTSEAPWIRWNLRSLLALRLFCEQYQSKKFGNSEPLSTTIGSLLRDRIARIEKEFADQIKPKSIAPDRFQAGLIKVAEVFWANQDISHDDLESLLKQQMQLDGGLINSLINHLTNHGLFVSFRKGFNGPLNPGTICYQPSYQPVIEFLIAIAVVNGASEKKELPQHLRHEGGVLSIAATILFIEHDILPEKNGLWGTVLRDEKLMELKTLALASAHPDRTKPYTEWAKIELSASMPRSRFILKNLCFPVSRIPKHPLGPKLVHEVLSSYSRAADRDLIWSGLDYFPANHGAAWEGHGPNPIKNEGYSLGQYDEFDGLPLLHAWNLASIDNEIVSRCSRNLVKWGAQFPDEFFRLFDMIMPSNDPQIEEAMVSCAYGIVTLLKTEQNKFIENLSRWLIKNVFNSESLKRYRSSIVRGAGRAILERAFQLKIISGEEANSARPPFDVDFEPLPLHIRAAREKESYGPIWHDLAWYTIKNAYNGFFEHETEKYHQESDDDYPLRRWAQESEIEYVLSEDLGSLVADEKEKLKKFLVERREELKRWKEEHQPKLSDEERAQLLELLAEAKEEKAKDEAEQETQEGIKRANAEYYSDASALLEKHCAIAGFEFGPHQLALGSACQFLMNLGWNEETFYGKPNGGNEGEILGADLAVTRQHFMASHGSRTKKMSFAEKYIWAAVHYLQGYFSDYIEFSEINEERKRVNDYSLIVDIPNPAQSITPKYNSNKREGWIGSFSLSPNDPSINGDLKPAISKWVQDAEIPDLSKLILPERTVTQHLCDEDMCLIHSFTAQTEITGLGESLLWVHGFLIAKKDLASLESNLRPKNVFIRDRILEAHSGMTAGVECECYISPRDAVFLSWKNELGSTISVPAVSEGKMRSIVLHMCVTEITSTSTEHGERTFHLPSKILREGLGITDGDGYTYTNDTGKILSVNVDSGQAYRDSQDNLYVDRTTFLAFAEKLEMVPVWLVRFDRRQSTKAFHSVGRIEPELIHCFLYYWKDGTLFSFSFDPADRH